MRLASSSRRIIGCAALAVAFLAGVGIARFERDAHAQAVITASSIYVPPGGLVFRAMDGSPLARISRDERGGTLEVFDDRHQTSGRLPAPARPPVAALVAPYPLPAVDRSTWIPVGNAVDPGY